MPFTLDQIVPWGRSYAEYLGMFALAPADLDRSILGVGDGPASFNAGMHRRGRRAVSVDPLYRFGAAEIEGRIAETCPVIVAQLEANRDAYLWDAFGSPQELGRRRMAAMAEFLADYPAGRAAGRYVDGELPHLPFADGAFDLALSSHLLFTYGGHLSADFHVQAAVELCRVAAEVRIFPLVDLAGRPSPHLQAVTAALAARGRRATVERVPYHFQRGGDAMLRVRPAILDPPRRGERTGG